MNDDLRKRIEEHPSWPRAIKGCAAVRSEDGGPSLLFVGPLATRIVGDAMREELDRECARMVREALARACGPT